MVRPEINPNSWTDFVTLLGSMLFDLEKIEAGIVEVAKKEVTLAGKPWMGFGRSEASKIHSVIVEEEKLLKEVLGDVRKLLANLYSEAEKGRTPKSEAEASELVKECTKKFVLVVEKYKVFAEKFSTVLSAEMTEISIAEDSIKTNVKVMSGLAAKYVKLTTDICEQWKPKDKDENEYSDERIMGDLIVLCQDLDKNEKVLSWFVDLSEADLAKDKFTPEFQGFVRNYKSHAVLDRAKEVYSILKANDDKLVTLPEAKLDEVLKQYNVLAKEIFTNVEEVRKNIIARIKFAKDEKDWKKQLDKFKELVPKLQEKITAEGYALQSGQSWDQALFNGFTYGAVLKGDFGTEKEKDILTITGIVKLVETVINKKDSLKAFLKLNKDVFKKYGSEDGDDDDDDGDFDSKKESERNDFLVNKANLVNEIARVLTAIQDLDAGSSNVRSCFKALSSLIPFYGSLFNGNSGEKLKKYLLKKASSLRLNIPVEGVVRVYSEIERFVAGGDFSERSKEKIMLLLEQMSQFLESIREK
jgi:hypothetical protein